MGKSIFLTVKKRLKNLSVIHIIKSGIMFRKCNNVFVDPVGIEPTTP